MLPLLLSINIGLLDPADLALEPPDVKDVEFSIN